MLTAAVKLKDFLEEKLWKPWQHGKKQRHHFTNKGSYCQSYGFSSSNVWMWMFEHKEGWVPKNWFFDLWCWRRLLSPLDCKEIKPANPQGHQFWIVIGRTDAEAEAPILWSPYVKNWLIRKDPDWERLGKIEGRRRRGQQRMRWLDGITESMDMSPLIWASSTSWWWTGKPGVLQSKGITVGHDWATELN